MSAPLHQDTAELDAARRRIEDLVCGLPDAGDQPFEQPWELRAFAMAVAAYDNGHYAWSEFQLSLVESIRRWEAENGTEPWSYYEHWLTALETVLAANGTLSGPVLDERAHTVLSTPRNANHHHAVREPVAVDPAVSSSR